MDELFTFRWGFEVRRHVVLGSRLFEICIFYFLTIRLSLRIKIEPITTSQPQLCTTPFETTLHHEHLRLLPALE